MIVLLSVLAATSFGAASVFVRVATVHLGATKVAILSLVAGLALMIPITFAAEWSALFGLDPRLFVWVVLIGSLQFAVGRQLNYTGVQLAGVSRATPFFGTVPMFASLLAVTLTDERVTPALGVGIGAVVTGSLLVARVGGTRPALRAGGAGAIATATRAKLERRVLLGMAAALGAAACYGAIQFLGRRVLAEVPSLTATTVGLAAGTVATMAAAGIGLRMGAARQQAVPRTAYFMAGMAGVASAVGVLCMFLALDRGAVVKVSPIIALNPLVSVALGQVFIRHMERLSVLLGVGIAVMIGGVVVVTLSGGG